MNDPFEQHETAECVSGGGTLHRKQDAEKDQANVRKNLLED
jgi:hypothetical protein